MGFGVNQNFRLMLDLYSDSARRGDSEGLYRLGECYEQGLGVEENFTTALNYYRQAADYEHPSAAMRAIEVRFCF